MTTPKSKSQINFRMPEDLIAALKDRAELEGITSTELAIRLIETGLGLPPSETASVDLRIEERIANQLAPLEEKMEQRIEERIAIALASFKAQLEERILTQLTTHLEPLRTQILELAKCIAEHIATQIAPLEEELEERTEKLIHDVIEEKIRRGELPKIEEDPTPTVSSPLVPTNLSPHNQMQLARRWGMVSKRGKPDNSQISRKKSQPNFTEWSRSKDPGGIGWCYREPEKLFYPVM